MFVTGTGKDGALGQPIFTEYYKDQKDMVMYAYHMQSRSRQMKGDRKGEGCAGIECAFHINAASMKFQYPFYDGEAEP